MPQILVEADYLVVALATRERFAALSGDIRVPLADVREAAIEPHALKQIGWRVGGTGWFTFAAGHFRKRNQRQFVYWHLKDPVVRIELDHERYRRLFIGVPAGLEEAGAIVAKLNELNR